MFHPGIPTHRHFPLQRPGRQPRSMCRWRLRRQPVVRKECWPTARKERGLQRPLSVKLPWVRNLDSSWQCLCQNILWCYTLCNLQKLSGSDVKWKKHKSSRRCLLLLAKIRLFDNLGIQIHLWLSPASHISFTQRTLWWWGHNLILRSNDHFLLWCRDTCKLRFGNLQQLDSPQFC